MPERPGAISKLRGEFPKAHSELERAIRHRRAAVEIRPRDESVRQALADDLTRLGTTLDYEGKSDQAEAVLKEATKVHGELADAFPDVADYAAAKAKDQYCLGSVYETLHRTGEAEDLLRRTAADYERLRERWPDQADYLHQEAGAPLQPREDASDHEAFGGLGARSPLRREIIRSVAEDLTESLPGPGRPGDFPPCPGELASIAARLARSPSRPCATRGIPALPGTIDRHGPLGAGKRPEEPSRAADTPGCANELVQCARDVRPIRRGEGMLQRPRPVVRRPRARGLRGPRARR